MNWLGKVFVVVILIMSLVFMGLAMAVYATHKNWKVANENLSKELDQAKAEFSKLESTHNLRVEELEREKTTAVQQATKLEQERVALIDRNLQAQTELDGLRQNQREHIAAVKSTQDINQALTTDVADLRTRIRDEQQKRDRVFKTALDATEQLHQAASEYERTKEENQQLLSQTAGMKSVLNANGINPNTPPDAVVPKVEGVVNKRATDSSLEKINDAVLTQSIFGRIFGFGDLDVLTAAEAGIERFRMISSSYTPQEMNSRSATCTGRAR